jgi:hypothetical protein
MRTTTMLLATLLALPAGAGAQVRKEARTDEAALMRRRVVQLEDRVATLEKEVARLERIVRSQAVAQARTPVEEAFPDDGWRDRENWRRLEPGLSEVEVRYLLGEPARIAVIDFSTFWYYPAPRGGWVKLDREGRNVVSWAEP